jgi:carbamate kinase
MGKTAVVAIGGNSLVKDENHQTAADQLEAIKQVCIPIANMIAQGWKIAVTHGNGPQVGFILLRSELASNTVHTVPLDVCGAETQGEIGYMIQQSLQNELAKRGVEKCVASVVTQVVVDAKDPAFKNPTKPIGPFYERKEAEECERKRHWRMAEDAGRGWRRVVPSPTPVRIVELDVIKALINRGLVPVCVGGGGIPVVENADELVGVEAVVDKDLSSALLAIGLKADLFLISTTVEKVALNFGKTNQHWIDHMTLSEAEKYLMEGHFPAGSMGPKIQAVINYLATVGKKALITSPDCIERALLGETGTCIIR